MLSVNLFPPLYDLIISPLCITTLNKFFLKILSPICHGNLSFKKKGSPHFKGTHYVIALLESHLRKKELKLNILEFAKVSIKWQEVSGMRYYIGIGMLSFQTPLGAPP